MTSRLVIVVLSVILLAACDNAAQQPAGVGTAADWARRRPEDRVFGLGNHSGPDAGASGVNA